MDTLYARMNFLLDEVGSTKELIQEWQEVLHDAAIWNDAEDADVFYLEKERVIGVSIPLENDLMLTLEVGVILGAVKVEIEKSKLKFLQNWISIHDANDNVIESTV